MFNTCKLMKSDHFGLSVCSLENAVKTSVVN